MHECRFPISLHSILDRSTPQVLSRSDEIIMYDDVPIDSNQSKCSNNNKMGNSLTRHCYFLLTDNSFDVSTAMREQQKQFFDRSILRSINDEMDLLKEIFQTNYYQLNS